MGTAYEGPQRALASYNALVALYPAVVRKGVTTPYTSVNGHMFSFLDPSGALSLRLSPDARREFLAGHQSTLSEQHGRVMAEFVVVPPTLLEHMDELSPWFERSYQWTSTRRPKPTRR